MAHSGRSCSGEHGTSPGNTSGMMLGRGRRYVGEEAPSSGPDPAGAATGTRRRGLHRIQAPRPRGREQHRGETTAADPSGLGGGGLPHLLRRPRASRSPPAGPENNGGGGGTGEG